MEKDIGLTAKLATGVCVEAGHGDVLESLYFTMFGQIDAKKYCIWLWGDRSTGKSTVMGFLAEIFNVETVSWQSRIITRGSYRG